jgi:uncharacterized membrane protein
VLVMSDEVRDVSPRVRKLLDLRPVAVEPTTQQISELHAAMQRGDEPDFWPPDEL